MAVLKVTSRGQATFRRDVLRHLGIRPGDTIEVDLLPGGLVQLSAARPHEPVAGLVGLLHGRASGALTIEQIRAVTAEAGGGATARGAR